MAVVHHIKKNGRSLVNSRMVLHVLVAVAVVCGSLVASVQAGFGTTATPVTTRKKDSFTRLWFSSYLDSLSAASAAAATNNNYNNNNNGYNNMGQQQQQQPQQPQQPQQQTVESTQQYLQQLQTQAQRPQYNTPAPSNTAAAVATPPPTNNPALGAAATYQQYAATAPAYNANNSWNPAVASTAVVPPPAAPAAATTTTATAPPQAFSPPQTAQVPTVTTNKASAVAKPAAPPKKPAVEIDEQAVKASRLQKDSIEIKSAARDAGSVEDSLKSNQMGTALEFLAVASLYVGIPFFLDSNWPQIEQQFNNLVTTSNQVEGEAEQLLGNAMKRDLKALFTPMAQAPPKPSTMIQQGAAQSATGWGAFLERNTLKTTPQMDVDAVRGRLLMTDYYKNKQAAALEASSSTAASTAAAVSAVVVEAPAAPTVLDTSTPPVVPPEPAAAAAAAAASLVDDAAPAGAADATAAILEEQSVTAPSTPLAAPEAPVESVSAAPVTESVPSNPTESTAPIQAATQMTEPVVASGEENGLAAGTTATPTTTTTTTTTAAAAAAAAATVQAAPVSFTPTTTVATADDYYYYNYYNPVDPTTAVIASHLDVAPTMLQEEEVAGPLSFEGSYLAQKGQFMPMSPTEYLVDDTGTATYDAGVTAEQSAVTIGTITLGYYDASLF